MKNPQRKDPELGNRIPFYRFNILIHAFIKEVHNDSIISDEEFKELCDKLIKMQKDYPYRSLHSPRYEAFKDFDGTNLSALPYNEARISATAIYNKHKRMKKYES